MHIQKVCQCAGDKTDSSTPRVPAGHGHPRTAVTRRGDPGPGGLPVGAEEPSSRQTPTGKEEAPGWSPAEPLSTGCLPGYMPVCLQVCLPPSRLCKEPLWGDTGVRKARGLDC